MTRKTHKSVNSKSLLQHWRDEKGFDLYPVLRLILPQVRFKSIGKTGVGLTMWRQNDAERS